MKTLKRLNSKNIDDALLRVRTAARRSESLRLALHPTDAVTKSFTRFRRSFGLWSRRRTAPTCNLSEKSARRAVACLRRYRSESFGLSRHSTLHANLPLDLPEQASTGSRDSPRLSTSARLSLSPSRSLAATGSSRLSFSGNFSLVQVNGKARRLTR